LHPAPNWPQRWPCRNPDLSHWGMPEPAVPSPSLRRPLRPDVVRFPEFGFFRDAKANDWSELEKSERFRSVHKALGGKDLLPAYAVTGAGEAGAAFVIAQLLATRKHDLQLTRSNTPSWQQIADQDVVFLGPPKFNLQLQEAALMQDIVIEAGGVRNRRPQTGEPEFLEDRLLPGKTNEGETHALITRTAGPNGQGEFLMIAGNAS